MTVVSVLGIGRVGLPHALLSALKGNIVFGIDIKNDYIELLKRGISPFGEPDLQALLLKTLNRTFFPTTSFSPLEKSDYILVQVGLKGPSISVDRSHLMSLFGSMIQYLHGQTIISRVTSPVGTTDKVKAYLETRGRKEGRDFRLVFSPERVVEGKEIEEERSLPVIVGAYNEEGFESAGAYFRKITSGQIIRVSSPSVAELIKLLDNAWRNLKFAFANDVALLAEEIGMDVFEVVEKANLGYDRNDIPRPSWGVSGYCLSTNPYMLEQSFLGMAKKRGLHSVWYYGRKANDYLVSHTVELVDALSRGRKNVLVAGLSYKENVDDFRDSHGVKTVEQLLGSGYRVSVYDPYLDVNSYTILPGHVATRVRKCSTLKEALKRQDVAILTVKHSEFRSLRQSTILANMNLPPIIIDCWGFLDGTFSNPKVVYRRVGLG